MKKILLFGTLFLTLMSCESDVAKQNRLAQEEAKAHGNNVRNMIKEGESQQNLSTIFHDIKPVNINEDVPK